MSAPRGNVAASALLSQESRQAAIGLDIGGTSIKAALVDHAGHLHFRREAPTAPATNAEEVVRTIVAIGREVDAAARDAEWLVRGVGFALPHYSIGPEWVQTYCTNIPVLEGYKLRPALAASFGDRIAVEFDTQAATLGELRYGAGARHSRFILIVLGTGISSGIVVDGGALLRHTFGTAGETGHIIVDATSIHRCATAGCRGCLESFASSTSICRTADDAIKAGEPSSLGSLTAMTAQDVAAAALAGDVLARRVFNEAGWALGVAMTTLMHIYCPEAILIGGGIAAAGDLLLEPARRVVEELAAPYFKSRLQEIAPAHLGRDAGIVGAAVPFLSSTRAVSRVRV